jgi:hypothetical protein
MQESPNEITHLLQRWQQGDRKALDQLMPIVYDELRRLAHHYLSGERKEHTLQPTALVNEAYLRLVGQLRPSGRTGRSFSESPPT